VSYSPAELVATRERRASGGTPRHALSPLPEFRKQQVMGSSPIVGSRFPRGESPQNQPEGALFWQSEGSGGLPTGRVPAAQIPSIARGDCCLARPWLRPSAVAASASRTSRRGVIAPPPCTWKETSGAFPSAGDVRGRPLHRVAFGETVIRKRPSHRRCCRVWFLSGVTQTDPRPFARPWKTHRPRPMSIYCSRSSANATASANRGRSDSYASTRS
jgi:hypothetical protein